MSWLVFIGCIDDPSGDVLDVATLTEVDSCSFEVAVFSDPDETVTLRIEVPGADALAVGETLADTFTLPSEDVLLTLTFGEDLMAEYCNDAPMIEPVVDAVLLPTDGTLTLSLTHDSQEPAWKGSDLMVDRGTLSFTLEDATFEGDGDEETIESFEQSLVTVHDLYPG